MNEQMNEELEKLLFKNSLLLMALWKCIDESDGHFFSKISLR